MRFKCFRAPIADDLFRQQTLDGWSFDIELLFVAYRRGYRVVRSRLIGITGREQGDGVRDALRMINDIFRIRANTRAGATMRTEPNLAFERRLWKHGFTYVAVWTRLDAAPWQGRLRSASSVLPIDTQGAAESARALRASALDSAEVRRAYGRQPAWSAGFQADDTPPAGIGGSPHQGTGCGLECGICIPGGNRRRGHCAGDAAGGAARPGH